MYTPNYKERPDFRYLNQLGFSTFIMPRGSKRPTLPWKKYQKERPSVDQISDWQGSNSNAAIVTGKISDLLVLDVDSEAGQQLMDEFDLPKTVTVKTSKGRHYFFRYPPVGVRNKVRVKGVELDVRGEGGYVVAPGSSHPDGSIYQWEVGPDQCDIAQVPDALLDAIKSSDSSCSLVSLPSSAEFLEAGRFSVWLNREHNEGVQTLLGSEPGVRNDTLFKVAVRMANHVAALELDWPVVASELTGAALSVGLPKEEIQATLNSAWKIGKETPTAWIKVARNWVYVASQDKFWSPATGQELRPSAFSMQFADKNPFEKGSMASLLTRGGLIERVLNRQFEPTRPSGVFELHGEKFYNSYTAPQIASVDGDWSPFVDFLAYLVPDKMEREHLVKMMAWTIANPGKKLSYALLLQSEEQGIGKSTLIEIWRHLLGFENTRETTSQEMDSQYQSYIENKILVVIDELDLRSGLGVYQRLKALITNPTVAVNVKHLVQRELPNLANFVFLSNLDTPILIEPRDRRFFVIKSPASRRPQDYWRGFQDWWRQNLPLIKGYLENVELEAFNPKAVPPMTQAKSQLVVQSEAPLKQNLRQLIEEMEWPLREVCTLRDINDALKRSGQRTETLPKLTQALKELGCEKLKQVRLPSGERPSLWALERTDFWRDAEPSEMKLAYG